MRQLDLLVEPGLVMRREDAVYRRALKLNLTLAGNQPSPGQNSSCPLSHAYRGLRERQHQQSGVLRRRLRCAEDKPSSGHAQLRFHLSEVAGAPAFHAVGNPVLTQEYRRCDAGALPGQPGRPAAAVLGCSVSRAR